MGWMVMLDDHDDAGKDSDDEDWDDEGSRLAIED